MYYSELKFFFLLPTYMQSHIPCNLCRHRSPMDRSCAPTVFNTFFFFATVHERNYIRNYAGKNRRIRSKSRMI